MTPTNNLKTPTGVSCIPLLDAVSRYEKESGFEALHFRQLPKTSSRVEKIAALRSDKHWWELHAQEIERNLGDAIHAIATEREASNDRTEPQERTL